MTSHPTTTPTHRPRAYGAFYVRSFVSMVMITSLVAFTISGLALFVAPSGQMAYTIGWRLIGLDKGQWEALHIAFGFLWMPLAVLHLAFNRRVVAGYLRDRARRAYVWRREVVAALGVTAFLAFASVLELPPVAQLMEWEESFSVFWAERTPTVVAATTAPAGGAAGFGFDRGPGIGRYATFDPETGQTWPVGKEAAARLAALQEEAASEETVPCDDSATEDAAAGDAGAAD